MIGPGSAPLTTPESKAAAVRRMFGSIAPRYDLLNHLLSLNIDRSWRRRAVDRLLETAPLDGAFLDACCGTYDLALELADRPGFCGFVAGSDFALPMLEEGRAKLEARAVAPSCADALHLPFADGAFDGALIGFGLRNLVDLDAGLRELVRVLRPGAPLCVLEFTVPRRQPMRALYLFYFLRVLPLIGRLVSRHDDAYSYLPASVLEFPEPAELAQRMRAAGFGDVGWTSLTGGIAAVHYGRRR